MNHLAQTHDIVHHAAERLRALGGRMTTPRRAVLQTLADHPGHWTAEDVVDFVADADPTVHRSSVYRSLEALVHLGVIAHVHIGHGTTVYHLADEPRLHAQCRHCGVLIDLPPEALDSCRAFVFEQHGFDLDPTHVALSGTCAACREQAPVETPR